MINSRPCRPRINGKPGRFYRSVEDVVWRYNCPDDYIEYCNTDRLHWALDVDNYETPLMAFRNKAATDNVVRRDPEWNGGGHQWLTHCAKRYMIFIQCNKTPPAIFLYLERGTDQHT